MNTLEVSLRDTQAIMHPEMQMLLVLETILEQCEISLASSKPEIAIAYPEASWGCDMPYMHAGRLVLRNIESMKEALDLYRNIINAETMLEYSKEQERRDEIPF